MCTPEREEPTYTDSTFFYIDQELVVVGTYSLSGGIYLYRSVEFEFVMVGTRLNARLAPALACTFTDLVSTERGLAVVVEAF